MQTEQKNCRERVKDALESRMEDIRKLIEADQNGIEDLEDLGNINDYGLGFDYVAPHTFTNQEHGYFRWQISYGGPSEEFRFFADADLKPYKVQFWFLDWFDGAFSYLSSEDERIILEWFESLKDCGTVQHVFDIATE